MTAHQRPRRLQALAALVLFALPGIGRAPAPSLPTFTDVTAAAGISVTGLGNSSSWIDVDADGRLDLLVTNSDFPGRVYLYRNDGDGTFTDVTTKAGFGGLSLRSVSWGDYDGDGRIDLAATTYASGDRAYLFHNLGKGRFKEVGAAAGLKSANLPWRVVFEDYDGNGTLDLYEANDGPNYLCRNDGDGTFTEVAALAGVAGSGFSTNATWADFDGDGRPDLFVTEHGADHLYRNRGDGTFAEVTTKAGVSDPDESVSACWGDYDGDGRPDLYVVDIGAFGSTGLSGLSGVSGVSGLSGVSGTASITNHLYHNRGDGTFADAIAKAGVADVGDGRTCTWVDIDGDGRLDLYAADHVHDSRLYRNLGNGRFKDVGPAVGLSRPFDVFNAAWGDFDADGDPDVFLVGHDGNVLLRNDGPTGAFVHLLLTGTVDNTSGIGAVVSTKIAGIRMVRRVEGAGGQYGQNSLALEFGTGTAPGPFTLRIVWPTGVVQRVRGVMPGSLVRVVEPG